MPEHEKPEYYLAEILEELRDLHQNFLLLKETMERVESDVGLIQMQVSSIETAVGDLPNK